MPGALKRKGAGQSQRLSRMMENGIVLSRLKFLVQLSEGAGSEGKQQHRAGEDGCRLRNCGNEWNPIAKIFTFSGDSKILLERVTRERRPIGGNPPQSEGSAIQH